jgi:hypothetical protein
MAFSKVRTALKNRMHSTLAKYALSIDTDSDIFAPKWRSDLEDAFAQLPEETCRCAHQQLQILDALNEHIRLLEHRIVECIHMSPSIQLIQTIPGPVKVLAIVIDRELGSIDRFASPKHFTSYCGLVPKVSSSAGCTHYGRMVNQCNNYLKWAFIEAANVVVTRRNHPNWRCKHVSVLYERIRRRKGHSVAVVARYLAEATYWVLKKSEPYREPPHWDPAGKKSLSRSARDRSVPNMDPLRSAS